MTWQEALEIAVAKTKHERLRALCADSNEDCTQREGYRAAVIRLAGAEPGPLGDCREQPSYPPFATMAGNALRAGARAVGAIVRGEAVAVDQAEQARRLAICKVCDRYDQAAGRCTVCGCVGAFKTWLATEHCPLPEPKW